MLLVDVFMSLSDYPMMNYSVVVLAAISLKSVLAAIGPPSVHIHDVPSETIAVDDDEDSPFPAWAIALIIIALLAAMTVIAYKLYRRRKAIDDMRFQTPVKAPSQDTVQIAYFTSQNN